MTRKRLLCVWAALASVLFATSALAALDIDAAFDSGSIGPYTIDDANSTVSLTLPTEILGNISDTYTYWTYFKILGALNRTVTFHITNASMVPFLKSTTNEAQLVYSCDGENWNRLTNHSYLGGTYTFSETFTCDEPQIATFFPFSYTRMRHFVDIVSTSEWVNRAFLGSSEQGRDIDLLTITNPAIPTTLKKIVYIIGRQHAGETASSHMLEGLIDFLISDDVSARGFRNHYIWHIVPMVNPDGVWLGYSRGTSELRDPNRDWYDSNKESLEINNVRAHMNSINNDPGIDMFIDWHSQVNEVSWYNYTYAPSGNTFFPLLSDWTDFDSENIIGTSCSSSSCSARGYATVTMGVPMFGFEPTPHLVTWTEDALKRQGVNFAFAVNDYFGLFEGPLLVDSGFDSPTNSDALRIQGPGRGWYESRNDDPGLLSLDKSDIGGDAGKKAKFTGSVSGNAYVTQRFGRPQDDMFAVRWQIYVDAILDDADRDRGALMLMGDGGGTPDGPNAIGSERFVCLAFWSPGAGGDPDDTMSLIALEPGGSENISSTWKVIASGLSLHTWHTITVVCNPAMATYDVYLNGDLTPAATVSAYTPKNSLIHISFAQTIDSAGTFYVDNIEDAALSVFAMQFGRTDCIDRCMGDADIDNDVDGTDLAGLIAKLAQAECR